MSDGTIMADEKRDDLDDRDEDEDQAHEEGTVATSQESETEAGSSADDDDQVLDETGASGEDEEAESEDDSSETGDEDDASEDSAVEQSDDESDEEAESETAADEPMEDAPEDARTLEERVRRLEEVFASLNEKTVQTTRPESSTERKRPWLLLDTYAEIRVYPRMYFDPRHRMKWYSRLIPPLLIAAMFLSGWWLGTWLINDTITAVVRTCVNLLLGFVAFKILNREATRYRETSPDLPSSMQL